MSYIKIIRLKTGEDVIGFLEPGKSTLKIRYPVTIQIHYDFEEERQELLMKYWLPVSLIEENSAEIQRSEILLIMGVKKEFREYYLNYLNDFTKITDEEPEKEELLKAFLEAIDSEALGKAH